MLPSAKSPSHVKYMCSDGMNVRSCATFLHVPLFVLICLSVLLFQVVDNLGAPALAFGTYLEHLNADEGV